MINNDTYKAIAELDLEPIKFKLMHQTFGEGWSRARADAIDLEYRRFLYLQYANPNQSSSPTADVDTFWHYHILDTLKYAADCDQAFGYFMHHYPYLGLLDSDEVDSDTKAAERTRVLYEATFGEPYIRAEVYGAQDASDGTARDSSAEAARCQPCIAAKAATSMAQAARCQPCISTSTSTSPQAKLEAKGARCQPCISASAGPQAKLNVKAARCQPCISARPEMTAARCQPCIVAHPPADLAKLGQQPSHASISVN